MSPKTTLERSAICGYGREGVVKVLRWQNHDDMAWRLVAELIASRAEACNASMSMPDISFGP